MSTTLRKKCPNTNFFLVRIFPHADGIRRDTPFLSVFSPYTGKYGPEKICICYFSVYLKQQVSHKTGWTEYFV